MCLGMIFLIVYGMLNLLRASGKILKSTCSQKLSAMGFLSYLCLLCYDLAMSLDYSPCSVVSLRMSIDTD